jgi:hypothetical protein
MKATSIRYGLTVNLGDYQSVKVEIEAEATVGETAIELYDQIRSEVHRLGEAELTARGNFEGRAAAPGMKFAVVAAPAGPAPSKPSGKAALQKAVGQRSAPGRKSTATEQPEQTVPNDKLLWKKTDWVDFVSGFDAGGVLNTFKSEAANKELYANLEAWKLCCEAFADQARKVIGPDDTERPEMVAMLQAERDRINNPPVAKAKKPRAPRKPKATQAV